MATTTEGTHQHVEDQQGRETENSSEEDVLKFRNRMLKWPNPVEYVNNMYGSHPDNDDSEYFKAVFAK